MVSIVVFVKLLQIEMDSNEASKKSYLCGGDMILECMLSRVCFLTAAGFLLPYPLSIA